MQVRDERVTHLRRVFSGRNTKVELCGGLCLHGGNRADHGRGVDAENRDYGSRIQMVGHGTRAEALRAFEQAGVGAVLGLAVGQPLPHLVGSNTRHGRVAVLVTQRRQHAHEGSERVGRRPAELSRVHRCLECLDPHDHVDCAAQAH